MIDNSIIENFTADAENLAEALSLQLQRDSRRYSTELSDREEF